MKNRFIDTHNFDGIDIDWQYPNGASGGPFDKQNFILLLKVKIKTTVYLFFFKNFFILKEFRNAMDPKQILSITISPLTDRIQNSYLLFDLNP